MTTGSKPDFEQLRDSGYLSHKKDALERPFDYVEQSHLVAKFKGGGAGDHPRRCAKRSSQTGKQCQKFGLIGTDPPCCRYHGAIQQLRKTSTDPIIAARNKNRTMPAIYKRFLRPGLSQFVTAAMELHPDEQLSLLEELALLRHAAGKTVEAYSLAAETVEEFETKLTDPAAHGLSSDKVAEINKLMPKLRDIQSIHRQEMSAMLLKVAELAEKAAKVSERTKGKYTLQHLQFAVDQILKIHWEVVGDSAIAEQFAEAVKGAMLIPTANNEPTKLHPDETAAMFDASVPFVDDEEGDE